MISTSKKVSFERWKLNLCSLVEQMQQVRPHLTILLEEDQLLFRWYEETYTISFEQVWTSFEQRKTLNSDPLEDLCLWASINLPVSAGEFSLVGRIDLHTQTFPRWRFIVRRVHEKKVYSIEFVPEEQLNVSVDQVAAKIKPQDFLVRSSKAVLILEPKSSINSASSALYNYKEIIAPHIDLTNNVRFLVSSTPTSPLYIGHANIIYRLSEGIEDAHKVFSMSEISDLRKERSI